MAYFYQSNASFRPALKRMVRYGNNFLQVCKQLGALTSQDWTPGLEIQPFKYFLLLQSHSQKSVSLNVILFIPARLKFYFIEELFVALQFLFNTPRSRRWRHCSPWGDGSPPAPRRCQRHGQAARHGGLRAEAGLRLRGVLQGLIFNELSTLKIFSSHIFLSVEWRGTKVLLRILKVTYLTPPTQGALKP